MTGPDVLINEPRYRRAADEEPLPGYRLLAPLGRGGFGEVWKCEAPGGLPKAVKFVFPDGAGAPPGESLRQEFDAFQQIKTIRHPFLLTLERVELVDGTLVMVMELADQHLHDRFRECAAAGHRGIPRGELIGYLADAAEALDLIASRHGLQHLDVKPANLFLVSGRGKVGDYGLVSRSQPAAGGGRRTGGFTPRYAPPELIDGRVHPRSDQYSLALVYYELLTGSFPWATRSANELMMMHAVAPPSLLALPAADRPAIGRALAKNPADRFPDCLALIQALLAAGSDTPGSLAVRRVRPSGATPPDWAWRPAEATAVVAPTEDEGLVQLTPVNLPPPAARLAGRFRPVVPVPVLTGRPHPGGAEPSAAAFTFELFERACQPGPLPQTATDPVRLADGTWTCRFPARVTAATAPFKLTAVAEEHRAELARLPDGRFRLRAAYLSDGTRPRRGAPLPPSGLEVVVRLPAGQPDGDVHLTAGAFGPADRGLAALAAATLPRLLVDIRGQLQNLPDRRQAPRVPYAGPLFLYPVDPDGTVYPPVPAKGVDLSPTGVCCVPDARLRSRFVYAEFPRLPKLAGRAVLVELVRHGAANAAEVAGLFRVDLEDAAPAPGQPAAADVRWE
ncbi:MAG: protein kinase [Gemmataceae bacterium]